MISRRSLLLTAAAATACSRKAPPDFTGYAYVANRTGQAVAVVDLSAFAVVRHIPLKADPTTMLTHPANPLVYALTPDTGTLHRIDPEKMTAGKPIGLDASPSKILFSPSGANLWAIDPNRKTLLRLPITGQKPDVRIQLPETPADFAIALDDTVSQHTAAVSLGESGKIALLNLNTGKLDRIVHIGGTLGSIGFRKDGKILVIASLEDRQLILYDVVHNRITVRLPLAVRPDRICFNADGGQVYITGAGADAVVTVYPYDTQVAGTLLAGKAPGYIAAAAAVPYVFVANPGSGDVTIINASRQKLMAVAPVGKQPCFIAITPGSEYALVLNRESGDMAVLHIATLSSPRTKFAPVFTMIPVGSEPVSAVVRRLT